MKTKSVKSINQWQSVIQTTHDIVKAHGGELKVETNVACPDGPVDQGEGTMFTILI